MSFNLLPEKYRPKPLFDIVRLRKLILGSLAAFLLVVAVGSVFYYNYSLNREVASLNKQIEDMEPVLERIEAREREIQDRGEAVPLISEAERREQTLNLLETKEKWSQILTFIAAGISDDLRFENIKKDGSRLLVTGESATAGSVADFAVKLQGMEFVEKAEIIYMDKLPDLELAEGADRSLESENLIDGLAEGEKESVAKEVVREFMIANEDILVSEDLAFEIVVEINNISDIFEAEADTEKAVVE